ncbi:bark storage protein A-like isoform X4 [Pyrus communis]|uniref:bark storage protein A-like isoform X4 n=1 Tax=Pyrus communis TaxID=23211 RepID=UPI0035C0CB77
MKYFHKSLYFPNQIFQNGYVTPCYSSCQNGEGLHGCHSSNRFLWLELQSTSFVADQKLPYLDFAGRRFRIGLLEDKRVIIVMTGLSMLNAGISTQLLQTLFKVKAVVHYGIAGNADPQLQIGDVTIPQFWPHTGLWNWQNFGLLEAEVGCFA